MVTTSLPPVPRSKCPWGRGTEGGIIFNTMKKWKKIIVWILRILSRKKAPRRVKPKGLLAMASVATSVRSDAKGTSGLKFSEQSQKWQALSSLRSDCRASERTIELLVVHCSATWPSIDYTLERLSRDHRARGFGRWPGYHVYIRRDGTVHYCRPVGVAGCHVSGFNQRSIGVCYEGGCSDSVGHKPEDNRTAEQLVAMHEVLKLLKEEYPEARIVGHRDLNGGKKACPCFEAKTYYAYLDPPPSPPQGRGVRCGC